MVRRDKNRRASSNSEAAGESPGQQTPNASNLRGRNNFFDDFETFYYTGHFADDSTTEIDALPEEEYPTETLADFDNESAYRPPADDSLIRSEEQASVPGIRRVIIPALREPTPEIEPEITEPVETLESPEPIEASADEWTPSEVSESIEESTEEPLEELFEEPVEEPLEAPVEVPVEVREIERPVIRRIAAPEPPAPTPVPQAQVELAEEDESQYTEHIHIVPSIGKSTVLEGAPKRKTSEAKDEDLKETRSAVETDAAEDEAAEAAEDKSAETVDELSEALETVEETLQATERIYFPAGITPEKKPVAEKGVVQEGDYVPKPKPEEDSEAEDKEKLESTDAIEIRRVLSLAEAIVLEQSLRAQNPLADLSTTEIEAILLDEIGDEQEDESEEEEPKPWHALLPGTLDLQESLNRAGEAIKPTKDSFDRWIGRPFRPRALPANFDTYIEPRKRSLLQEGRLEAETKGLILTSAALYALLWFIWLLLPTDFLGILKNQVSGQLVYQLLQAGMVLLIPLMLFAKYHPFPLGRIFGPVMPSGSQSFTSALIGIPLGVLVVSLQNLSATVLPQIYSSNLNRYMYMPQSLRPGSTVILWIIHILLPSFLEELFFRGNLFTGLMRQGYRRAAFVLPSLLYAFLFRDPMIFIPFLVGVALSWVRYRSASLFGSMIAHFSFTATIFLLYQNVPAFVRTMPLSSTAGQASLYASVVAAVVSAVTLVSLLAFVGTLQSPEQTNEFSQSRLSHRTLFQLRELRIGVLIYILIYLLNLGHL